MSLNLFSQIKHGLISDSLSDNKLEKTYSINQIQSTCLTPNGSMNLITSTPTNYSSLQSSGYCNPGSYGKNGTVCWTFTPTSDSVTVNSGYATNCNGFSFTASNLYLCSPSCALKGTGSLSFTVTAGQCYTWCLGYSGSGFGCSFSDFCPYFSQYVAVLPIELIFFAGHNEANYNLLQWQTITETNNDYFTIERSLDGLNWTDIQHVKGAGNSLSIKNYQYADKNIISDLMYYRLKQTDYNGNGKSFGIIAVSNLISKLTLIKSINLLGQPVDNDYVGVVFFYYSDGSIVRKVQN